MPEEYVTCRVLVGNHSPSDVPHIKNAPDGGFLLVSTCRFCGTEIVKKRDRMGFRMGSGIRYGYRSGYLMDEGGPLTKSEKAQLFLRQVGRSM